MKYTTVCLGLQAANPNIRCKCPKQLRHSTFNNWENELRTIIEIQQLKEKYGCIHQPLLPSIPIDHVMPDIYYTPFLKDLSSTLLNVETRKIQVLNDYTMKNIILGFCDNDNYMAMKGAKIGDISVLSLIASMVWQQTLHFKMEKNEH